MLKDGLAHSIAARQVREEVEHYKQALERNHTKHKIVDETTQEDGSVIVRIIKQYNQSPVGSTSTATVAKLTLCRQSVF